MGWTPLHVDGIEVPQRMFQQPFDPEGSSAVEIATIGLDLA